MNPVDLDSSHTELFKTPLGVPGLFKYQGTKKDRVPIFLKKLKDQSPFRVKTDFGFEDIVIDPLEYNKVTNWLLNPTSRLRLKARGCNSIVPFGSIIKTQEFGGEASGHRERIEQCQLTEIEFLLETAKQGNDFINLKVGDRVVHAASVIKTREKINGRSPKSDMSVLDKHGRSVAWASLKGHRFRWCGWLSLANEPEISSWLERIRFETGNEFEPTQSYGLHVSHDIKRKIIYGKDYGSAPGVSNVDCILIGDPVIHHKNNIFELTASTIYSNGEIPNNEHMPYLVLRYMHGRRELGFTNVRSETNTINEGRKVKWLDLIENTL